MKALKDEFFNRAFFKWLSTNLAECNSSINQKLFYDDCIRGLPKLELKQRITHTTIVCRKHFPQNYKASLKILYQLADRIDNNSFSFMFMPQYISSYGLSHYDTSIQALKDFTRYSSSELAIREFIKLDFEKTVRIMKAWALDDDAHVRRLASEGTRPRLPWATKLEVLIKNPQKTYPILNLLKQDTEKYVQKSVANHINDMSKDNADFIVSKIKRWNTSNANTAWVIKHGMRTLVKQGDKAVLSMFGAKPKPSVSLTKLLLNKKSFTLGEDLVFKTSISSTRKTEQQLCIDYKIYYMKNSGKQLAKVFKLKNVVLKHGQPLNLTKKHLFRDFTTRKHYSGLHSLELIINGTAVGKVDFKLHVPGCQ